MKLTELSSNINATLSGGATVSPELNAQTTQLNALVASTHNQNTALTGNALLDINAAVSAVSGTGINIGAAASVIECARSLEDRILIKLQEELINVIMSNPTAKNIAAAIGMANQYYNAIASLVDIIKSTKPEDLIAALLAAKTLEGAARIQKLNEIRQKFGGYVSNLNSILEGLATLDICSIPNVSSSGIPVPPPVLSPNAVPTPITPMPQSMLVNEGSLTAKNEYDAVMTRLKDYTNKDPGYKPDIATASQYQTMLTSVNTIAMSYHDKVIRSSSQTDDPRFFEEYQKSIQIELDKNASMWSSAIIAEYKKRAAGAGDIIHADCEKIRAYGRRTQPVAITGSLISTGITTYSGPDKDFTTYLDLKPGQRPSELTSYWQSRGYNIADQESRLNSRGIKTGTLNYSDAYSGAYGKLESDFTCASTRVPGGSVLALKNSDGTPYNPSGRNPSGMFTVTDTGNAKLTYDRPDIFTSNPELYKGMDAVQVFLVSPGSKTGKQYDIAQRQYGGKSMV